MECANHKSNLSDCNCSYPGCERKGYCCQCLAYHRSNNELPACFFPAGVEKTYDRSIRKFVETHKQL